MRGGAVRGAVVVAAVMAVLLAAPAIAAASPAVVLVSGFNTATPFTASAASCAGREGPTWSSATGAAAQLRAAGFAVFTAPVATAGGPSGAPCTGPGGATPPSEDVIDSNGDVDANGAALQGFLGFLAVHYGVTTVQLVGHSDGGLWSRSAITQMSAVGAGPTVQSLTTLGTPHTGSFGADLAELVVDGRCNVSSPLERKLCQAVIALVDRIMADLGPTTIRQLSSSFLQGWNTRQTIGCPVSVAAGTYLKVPEIGWLLPKYYNPSDGVVGQASALAQASTSLDLAPIPAPGIPHVVSLGTFPVIHSSTLSFLGTDDTLTNDHAVGAAVVQAVRSGATGAPCSIPSLRASPRPGAVVLRRRFRALDVPDRRGRLPVAGRGHIALLLPGASIRCHGRRLAAAPLLGSRRVRVVVLNCRRRLRIHGRALVLRLDQRRRELVVTRQGRQLTVRVRGPALRPVSARVRIGRRWRTLELGSTTLPARTGTVTIRVAGRDHRGERWFATALVVR
jgi:triacylglycerol lipase